MSHPEGLLHWTYVKVVGVFYSASFVYFTSQLTQTEVFLCRMISWLFQDDVVTEFTPDQNTTNNTSHQPGPLCYIQRLLTHRQSPCSCPNTVAYTHPHTHITIPCSTSSFLSFKLSNCCGLSVEVIPTPCLWSRPLWWSPTTAEAVRRCLVLGPSMMSLSSPDKSTSCPVNPVVLGSVYSSLLHSTMPRRM